MGYVAVRPTRVCEDHSSATRPFFRSLQWQAWSAIHRPGFPCLRTRMDDGGRPAARVCETGKERYIVSGAVMPMSARVRASAILLASTSFSRAFITGASDGSRVSTRQWS